MAGNQQFPPLEALAAVDADLARELARKHQDQWAPILGVAGRVNPAVAALLRPGGTAGAEGDTETETGNARRLVRMFGADLRYVHEAHGWYVWTGTHWEEDTRQTALARTAEVAAAVRAEAMAMDTDTPEARARQIHLLKWANNSLSERVRQNGLSLTAAEPGQTVMLSDFDRDPWSLNCGNGTVDLRTRQLRPHSRADLLSYCLSTPYHTDAACPRWRSFLAEIFEGNLELVDFIHRAAGYTLTASTREQCVLILHGFGANGKSVFVGTLRHVLGPLARHANMETFTSREAGRIPEDRARLRGARLVTVSESARGQCLDEAFIKDTTGGEPITARRLHENSVEFVPVFKLWLATNHRPAISGTDEGIWRRVRLVPFARFFRPEERDSELATILRGEAEGILAWLVDGCRRWQDEGLHAPAVVQAATAEYRSESDTFGQFMEDCCDITPEVTGRAGDLYHAYQEWAEENGFRTMGSKGFGLTLKERGYVAMKFRGERCWRGITLRKP